MGHNLKHSEVTKQMSLSKIFFKTSDLKINGTYLMKLKKNIKIKLRNSLTY
jgi:hypothetical protein